MSRDAVSLMRTRLNAQREPNRGKTHGRAQRGDVEMVSVRSSESGLVYAFVATRSGLSSTPTSVVTAIDTVGTSEDMLTLAISHKAI